MRSFLIILLIGCAAHIHGANVYTQRFLDQYNKIHNASTGYFSPQGVPYHSVETLMVEAPDHGHETTSEAYSYYVWLEAMYGAISGDYSTFNTAWNIMEQYTIPTHADQPTNSFYNPSSPATYAAELDSPSEYPSPMVPGVPVGVDPLHDELQSAYGSPDIYGMHWLTDVDNIYGFGVAPGKSLPSFKNAAVFHICILIIEKIKKFLKLRSS